MSRNENLTVFDANGWCHDPTCAPRAVWLDVRYRLEAEDTCVSRMRRGEADDLWRDSNEMSDVPPAAWRYPKDPIWP